MSKSTYAIAGWLCLMAIPAHAQHIATRAQRQQEIGTFLIIVALILCGCLMAFEAIRPRVPITPLPLPSPPPPPPPSPTTMMPSAEVTPAVVAVSEEQTPSEKIEPEEVTLEPPADTVLRDPDQPAIRAHLARLNIQECAVSISFEISNTQQTILIPGIARLKPDNGKLKFVYQGHEWPWDKRKQLIGQQLKISTTS